MNILSERVRFPFVQCRNISSPEDDSKDPKQKRRVYSGVAPASSFLQLDDNENVREYLVSAVGKKRRTPTLVHQAIRKTLENNTENFCILNGGISIVASETEIDDSKRVLTLIDPSIINGSQTQGELKRYFKELGDTEGFVEPHVRFEIIVTRDKDLIAEISIARNFQNDVKPLSIAGKLGQLEGLEASIKTKFPNYGLQKNESDLKDSEQKIDTEKLIQVTFALMPETFLQDSGSLASPGGKIFTYSQKTRCLKLFQAIIEDDESQKVYMHFLSLAPFAWELYLKWKSHQGFQGSGLRSIKRDDRGNILEVPDGILFPILAAHAEFVLIDGYNLSLDIPEKLDDQLIRTACRNYIEVAGSNPQSMGKSKACYGALREIAEIFSSFV